MIAFRETALHQSLTASVNQPIVQIKAGRAIALFPIRVIWLRIDPNGRPTPFTPLQEKAALRSSPLQHTGGRIVLSMKGAMLADQQLRFPGSLTSGFRGCKGKWRPWVDPAALR
ncbi:hypothetical protein GE253_07310 [Niveispirillum sp. SYP-B3756]|uniref:hypothetical protein n=1 Tax=Niveispirillum sp. SYP-B3756 TaxID=2662178 RepID=UPI001291A6C8|nr:hypothetical protein [Niveispirillum sp. SYP-B3756]MQP65155.1 hypothetical protein [Niveispirillum sp. SYP-B3756]